MRRSLPPAALAVLASGCLGGSADHPPRPMVTVPDVVHPGREPRTFGISADQAGAALHRAHLRMAIRTPFQFGSFWGERLVMTQSPAAGTRVAAGTPVRITVRQERGIAICANHPYVVGDVRGETLAQAARRLGPFFASIPALPPSRVTSWEDAYRVTWLAEPPGRRQPPCTSIRVRVRLA